MKPLKTFVEYIKEGTAKKQYLNRCRMHDSKIVLPLTKHHRLRVLCGDMGYDDGKVRRILRGRGTRPLIPHRAFKPKHRCWNSLLDEKLYHKRSLSETVNSVIKRKYSDTLYSKNWRSQFKELKLLAVVYNIDRKIRDLLEVFYRAINLKVEMNIISSFVT